MAGSKVSESQVYYMQWNRLSEEEDKPPNKGQAKSTHVYTRYTKSPLKEDNLSTGPILASSMDYPLPNHKFQATPYQTSYITRAHALTFWGRRSWFSCSRRQL